jgi:hypothetical protein
MVDAKIDVGQFRVPPGSMVSLDDHDPDSKAGFEGGKKDGKLARQLVVECR